jgi:RNA polymerase sigma factor (sigma-70 family)
LKGDGTTREAAAESDRSLLEAGRQGDARALSRLIDRHGRALTAFVGRRLGAHRDWAQDAVQDVLLTLQRTADRYEGRSTFRTWLFGIARNVCHEYLRRERALVPDDGTFAALPDASLDPLQRLERKEREALVRSAIADLPPAHRRVLRLRDGDGLAYEEIGRRLGIPIGTVRSRVHNARAALSRALALRLETKEKR